MYTRRKFVIQGSMATTALLALKPFNTAASALFPIKNSGLGYGKLIFLHTAKPDHQIDNKVIQHIAGIRSDNFNTIVLQAGQVARQQKSGPMVFDYCINEMNVHAAHINEYKIIRKGNIRTGIIIAKPEDANVVQNVNTLSAYLKKEENCNVVVCLSQLGYKNNNMPDDIALAKQSTHLDLIIGGNLKNSHQHPVILLNQNNEEVIIHSSDNDSSVFGKIEIDFNEQGQKHHISFSLS